MDLQQGQAILAILLLVDLQLALELVHPRPKLRHRLDLARVAVRGLVAPHHLAYRVLGNPQIPGELFDWNALHQMIPTDPRNRLHNQHLPPHLVRPTTRCVHGHKTRGVNFGRRSPPIGGQSSTLNNTWAASFRWRRCSRSAPDLAVIAPPDSDPPGRESRLRRHLSMTARPSCGEGWRRGDGRGQEGRSAGRCPRGGVGGHLEEVEDAARVPGQIAHGLGDTEPAGLDEADGEAPEPCHVLRPVA